MTQRGHRRLPQPPPRWVITQLIMQMSERAGGWEGGVMRGIDRGAARWLADAGEGRPGAILS